MKDKKGGFFSAFFRGLNLIRLIILNLIFFFLLFLFIAAIYKYNTDSKKPKTGITAVSADSVLLINPAGQLTEKADEFLWHNYLFSENTPDSVLLSDITDALVHAAHDRRITAVLFDLTSLYGIGLGHFSELKAAFQEYKESNKPLYVFAPEYRLGSYYIASFGDRIFLDPMGAVDISGFYSEALFYGGMEKKLGVQWDVIQAGAYKSMAETYSNTGFSDGVRQNYQSVFRNLRQTYIQDIAANRAVSAEQFDAFSLRYLDALRAANGDSAQAALNAGLVTDLATYEDCCVELDILDETYRMSDRDYIVYTDYNRAFKKKESENQIGIIHLNGAISSYSNTTNEAADSPSLIDLFDQAADDDSIKAIVLRIDSGGGEVNASEDIRRSLERLSKKIGKPVIVSMSDIAASGAYWIASSADYIFSSPYTITGSIGVLSASPNIQQMLQNYFGITSDAVSAEGRVPSSFFRSMTEEERQQYTLEIDHTYAVFLDKVSQGRGLPLKTVEELAQGKIYTGIQAKELQLVDELGGFADAVRYAATKVGIQENYSLKLLYKAPPVTDEILKSLLTAQTRLYRTSDLQTFHELLQLRSRKGFYVYTPLRIPREER